MSSLSAEQRDQMLSEIQRIPDGTIVAAYADKALFADRAESFHVAGPIWTSVVTGSRYVGDTHVMRRDEHGHAHLSHRLEYLKPIGDDAYRHERRQSSSVALSGLQQAVTDAGMDPK